MNKEFKVILKTLKNKNVKLITGIFQGGIPNSIIIKRNNYKFYKTVVKFGKKYQYLLLIIDDKRGYLNLGFEEKSIMLNYSIGAFSSKNRTLFFYKVQKHFILSHHMPFIKKKTTTLRHKIKKQIEIQNNSKKKIVYYYINQNNKKIIINGNNDKKKQNQNGSIKSQSLIHLLPHKQIKTFVTRNKYPLQKIFKARLFKALKYKVFLYSVQSDSAFSNKLKHSFGTFIKYVLKGILEVSKSDLPKFTRLLMLLHFMFGIYRKPEKGIQHHFNFCNKKVQKFLQETYMRKNSLTKKYEFGSFEKIHLILSICGIIIHLGKGSISLKGLQKLSEDLKVSNSQLKSYLKELGCRKNGHSFKLF